MLAFAPLHALSPPAAHRSLFEKDKLLFAFLLSCRILMSRTEGRLEPQLYQFLLTGGLGRFCTVHTDEALRQAATSDASTLWICLTTWSSAHAYARSRTHSLHARRRCRSPGRMVEDPSRAFRICAVPCSPLPGGVGIPEREVSRPEGADWLSAKAWGELCRAPNVCPSFEGLPETVSGCPEEWRRLFDSVEPQVGVGGNPIGARVLHVYHRNGT